MSNKARIAYVTGHKDGKEAMLSKCIELINCKYEATLQAFGDPICDDEMLWLCGIYYLNWRK